ncbi:alpha-amylase [bacterium]|nr:alpha-amylase [bacterium]
MKKWLLFLLLLPLLSCTNLDPIDTDGSFKMTSQVDDWRDEVIYQIFTDRFYDGDTSNNFNVDLTRWGKYHGGDWQGVIDKLDYLSEMGVTTIWISPVVKNVEEDAGFASYHGYWTQDFMDVNPHFGDMAKLREMVKAAHAKGIKIILDIVVNHIGQLFYYDINGNGYPDDYLIGGNGQPYGNRNGDYPSSLTRTSEWDPEFDTRGIQGFSSLGENGLADIKWMYVPNINRVPPMPKEFQNPNWYNRKGRTTVWYNFDSRDVSWRDNLSSVCEWLTTGDHGSRLGLDCSGCDCNGNCPCATEYIRKQETEGDFPGGLKDVKTSHPDVQKKMVEVFSWWIEMADFDGFRIDTVKHVEHEFWQYFAKGIRDFAKAKGKSNFLLFGEVFDGDDALLGSFTKDDELDSVFYFSQKFWLGGVVKEGNSPSSLEQLYNMRQTNYCADSSPTGACKETVATHGVPPTKLLVNFLDNHDVNRWLYESNKKALHNALMYLLTWDGIPCIYYGTEQDFNGGNDPKNRETMWLAKNPFSTNGDTFKLVKALNKIRADYVAMRRGEVSVKYASTSRSDANDADSGIFAFEKATTTGDKVLVVINFNPYKESSATIPNSLSGSLRNIFPDVDTNDTTNGGNASVTVPARGIKIFVPDAQAKDYSTITNYVSPAE